MTAMSPEPALQSAPDRNQDRTRVTHWWMWAAGAVLTAISLLPPLVPTIPGSDLRILWLPGALLALAFIIRPHREWPLHALIYAAIALAAEKSRADLAFDLVFIAIEIVQAMVFALVSLRYFRIRSLIGNPIGMMLYVIVALAVTAAGATLALIAAGSMHLSPGAQVEELAGRPALAWRTWWLANATGYVAFASSLRFLAGLRREQWMESFDDPRERLAFLGMATLLLIVSALCFPVYDTSAINLPPDVRLALALVPAPLGFAMAARYRGFGTTAAVLLISPFAILSATGPHSTANWGGLPPMAALMHLYVLVLTSTCWVLAAISRQLKWAIAEAIEAENRKARFVATINHELRTPLNAILGFSELMRLQELSGKGQPLENIHESGQRLLIIIEQLLSQSDRGASVFKLNKQKVRLARLLARTIEEIRPDCERQGCTIALEASDQLVVDADARALRQMFLVLLSHALRRSGPDSAITIRARAREAELVIDLEIHRPADHAQDSREKLELQLLNALALAQGGRLEILRSGRRSRLARLTFSGPAIARRMKRVTRRR